MLLLLISLAFAQDVPTAPAAVVPTSGNFDTAKKYLTGDGEVQARRLAELVLANPGWVFEVGVHTDSQGSDAYNLKLSHMRAESLVDAMVQAGVDRGAVVAKGYGETRPVASNGDSEGRGQNRRIELRKLRPLAGGSAVATSAAKPPPRPTAPPMRWQGFRRELRGELRSGDERREGKDQIDSLAVDVPFDATFDAYSFHSRDNDSAAALVGPDGRRVPLSPGKSQVPLTQGAWTLEVRDHKKASGTWGLRLTGISSEQAPPPGADACTVLDYLVAQAHVDMRGARGAEIDANFHEGPALPGMPGTARVHRNDEYWATLYEGTDEGAATAAWKTAGTLVQSCLSPDWSAGHRDWTTMALKFDQSVTWEEREVRWILPAGEEIVLITLSEEHRSTKAEASLYLYVTEPK